MTILVFGKTGQVATELQRQAPVVALGRDEADLSDPQLCAQAIAAHKPDAVINAAAYTAVDKAEDQEALAHAINAEAPGAMARACAALDIPFLHISTDYVFAGDGVQPWRPSDAVAPQNAYGRTKLAGERAVTAAGGRYAILRTAWVFSAHGNNFVKTMLRLAETRNALNVVDDQIGCPTPAADIAAALLVMADVMQDGTHGGIYHFGGQPPASWAEFARAIFTMTGTDMAVTGIPSSDYPTPATRPLNSRLACEDLKRDFGIAPPDWQNGLSKVLCDLNIATTPQ